MFVNKQKRRKIDRDDFKCNLPKGTYRVLDESKFIILYGNNKFVRNKEKYWRCFLYRAPINCKAKFAVDPNLKTEIEIFGKINFMKSNFLAHCNHSDTWKKCDEDRYNSIIILKQYNLSPRLSWEKLQIEHPHMSLSIESFNSIKSILYRKYFYKGFKLPQNFDELLVKIMKDYYYVKKKINFNEDYLPYYNCGIFVGRTNLGSFIFASEEGFYRLKNCNQMNIDGTFAKVMLSPLSKTQFPWTQIIFHTAQYYNDNAKYISLNFPSIAILCVNKTKKEYEEIAKIIVDFGINLDLDIRGIINMGSDFEDAFSAFESIYKIKNSNLGCFFHYIKNNYKYIKKLALSSHYRKYPVFKLEVNLIWYSCFLPVSDVLLFVTKSKYILLSSLPKDCSLCVAIFFQYWEKQWGSKNLKKCNTFKRKFEFTNNQLECFNRVFQKDYGKVLTIFNFLDAWKKVNYLSSMQFYKLKLYSNQSYEGNCNVNKVFNVSRKNSRETKKYIQHLKEKYLETKKEGNLNFDYQRMYVRNIYYAVKHKFEKLESYLDNDNVINSNCNEDVKVDDSEIKSLIYSCTITNNMRLVIKKALSIEYCFNLQYEIANSKFWIYLLKYLKISNEEMKKNGIDSKYLTKYDSGKYNLLVGLCIGLKPKYLDHYIPCIVVYVEKANILVFSPFFIVKVKKKEHWAVYGKNVITVALINLNYTTICS